MSGIPSWAVVGRKVICVDGSSTDGAVWEDDAPKIGAIYTIVRAWIDGENDPVVWLEELHRGPLARRMWGDDVGYYVYRFRPLISQSDDLDAHFSELLNVSTPQRVDA